MSPAEVLEGVFPESETDPRGVEFAEGECRLAYGSYTARMAIAERLRERSAA